MMDSSRKNEKFPELQIALENLKKSEIECADAAARYAQLETIIRKQIKSQLLEGSDSPNKTESQTSCKSDCKTVSSNSKFSSRPSKFSLTRSTEKIQKKTTVSSESLLKKSSVDIIGKTNLEQSKKAQLLKRIRQCHDSIEEVAMLSGKIIGEKKKFLNRLDKSNRDLWKSQKNKHVLVGKLEAHMNK